MDKFKMIIDKHIVQILTIAITAILTSASVFIVVGQKNQELKDTVETAKKNECDIDIIKENVVTAKEEQNKKNTEFLLALKEVQIGLKYTTQALKDMNEKNNKNGGGE